MLDQSIARKTSSLSGADLRPMDLLIAAPRGFCAGVRRAIDAVREALRRHGAPVYVRRPIVHNLAVVRALEAEGAIFVQELEEVPAGGVVILSAHGVAPAVAAQAEERGLTAYDAVCPLVAKVHREVERYARAGRHVVLIGHEGHPEIVGTLAHVPAGGSTLVRSRDDIASMALAPDAPIGIAVQTTYSVEEAADLVAAVEERFADSAKAPRGDICYATTNRQAALRAIAGRADAIIVVGETFSSNACRLAELASSSGCGSVQLVPGPQQLEWQALAAARTVGITAAASTPDESVDAVVSALAGSFSLTIEEVQAAEEWIAFRPLAIA